MLPDTAASKVAAAHLSRTALLYVRQSSLKQVIHNTESAIRQYDLRGKAVSLGWAADQITVIDIDQGHSGASAADREGFQHLVAEVSLGRAGIVLGLECSVASRCVELLQTELDCIRWPGVSADFGPGGVS